MLWMVCSILWGMFSKDYIERNEWGKAKEGTKCNNFEVLLRIQMKSQMLIKTALKYLC